MKLFDQITIVGVGLLGGSIAQAGRRRGLFGKIVGTGRNRANLEEARRLKIIDAFDTDPCTAAAGSDLVVLCTPVRTILPLARKILPAMKSGGFLTDVGSVKGPLVRDIEPLVPPGIGFVGSHPIAGGEKSGLRASSPDLYEGAKCIVTPTEKTDPEALRRTTTLWERLGMEVIPMDIEDHDLIFGAVSHLPHVVAYALMNTVGEFKTNSHAGITSFSAGGLKDITRIASSDPVMWRDICLSNRKPVLRMIDKFQETLGQIRSLIEKEESDSLEQAFAAANKYRVDLV